MTLEKILQIADDAYHAEGLILEVHRKFIAKDPDSCVGDTLAEFIAMELIGIYDATLSDHEQLREAHGAIAQAVDELEAIRNKFGELMCNVSR